MRYTPARRSAQGLVCAAPAVCHRQRGLKRVNARERDRGTNRDACPVSRHRRLAEQGFVAARRELRRKTRSVMCRADGALCGTPGHIRECPFPDMRSAPGRHHAEVRAAASHGFSGRVARRKRERSRGAARSAPFSDVGHARATCRTRVSGRRRIMTWRARALRYRSARAQLSRRPRPTTAGARLAGGPEQKQCISGTWARLEAATEQRFNAGACAIAWMRKPVVAARYARVDPRGGPTQVIQTSFAPEAWASVECGASLGPCRTFVVQPQISPCASHRQPGWETGARVPNRVPQSADLTPRTASLLISTAAYLS